MKNIFFCLALLCLSNYATSQADPILDAWLQNTTVTGNYYVAGNSTLIANNELVNTQKVEYSDDWVYVSTKGIPAYPTGPFQDGNPSQASDQDAIYKISRTPVENTGTKTNTNGGNIGIFINGVSLFDYRDGVGWNPQTMALCGGPGNPPCPGGMMAQTDWTRDAIPAEREGFDCAKGHPAMGNYHHHQNPSAFKLDIDVLSTVCNLYDSEGLYAMDSTMHSPLIGYAYDGFPIYGAYGYKNIDGTGGITRIKSGYALRNITERNTYADGTSVDQGPGFDGQYFLGYFREDYEHIDQGQSDYLDIHNGRYAVTPEYPDGTYAYYATVNADWTSAYPYVVGPTFYGIKNAQKVNNINESVETYVGTSGVNDPLSSNMSFTVFPNPSSDFIAIQANGLVKTAVELSLYDMKGQLIKKSIIAQGTTIWYLDIQDVYDGQYILKMKMDGYITSKKIVVAK